MNRREALAILTSAIAGLGILMAGDTAALARPGKADDLYVRCARACNDCKAACEACVKHCTAMIKAGAKEHEKTRRLSEDCGDICTTAARLCARKGPLTPAICEACAKACDACGAECGKHPDMKDMRDCARSCQVCAKACRELVNSHK